MGAGEVVRIAVIGVGGGGGNAVAMMCEEKEKDEKSVFKDIKIIAANTDVQALERVKGAEHLQLGPALTKGQGAGGRPECGKEAAEESKVDIATAFDGDEMVFVTAGMGGGTGTGAAAVVAGTAKDAGILTVGVVTKPFSFEGKKKKKYADQGIEELRKNVDALVVIPNDRVLDISGPDDNTIDMFKKPNEILIYAVKNISELIIGSGYVNVDFADVKTTMHDMGISVIGFGSAAGEHAPINAVKEALNNPLLRNFTISGSKKMLAYFSGAHTKMAEFAEASEYLSDQIDEDADFIWGVKIDDSESAVSVLIVTEAREEEVAAVKAKENTKAEENGTESLVQTAAPTNENEEIVVEIQPVLIEETLAPAAKAASKPVSINTAEPKPFNFGNDAVLIPDRNFDLNDKTVPAYLRRQKMNAKEEESIQTNIQEFEKKR